MAVVVLYCKSKRSSANGGVGNILRLKQWGFCIAIFQGPAKTSLSVLDGCCPCLDRPGYRGTLTSTDELSYKQQTMLSSSFSQSTLGSPIFHHQEQLPRSEFQEHATMRSNAAGLVMD